MTGKQDVVASSVLSCLDWTFRFFTFSATSHSFFNVSLLFPSSSSLLRWFTLLVPGMRETRTPNFLTIISREARTRRGVRRKEKNHRSFFFFEKSQTRKDKLQSQWKRQEKKAVVEGNQSQNAETRESTDFSKRRSNNALTRKPEKTGDEILGEDASCQVYFACLLFLPLLWSRNDYEKDSN